MLPKNQILELTSTAIARSTIIIQRRGNKLNFKLHGNLCLHVQLIYQVNPLLQPDMPEEEKLFINMLPTKKVKMRSRLNILRQIYITQASIIRPIRTWTEPTAYTGIITFVLHTYFHFCCPTSFFLFILFHFIFYSKPTIDLKRRNSDPATQVVDIREEEPLSARSSKINQRKPSVTHSPSTDSFEWKGNNFTIGGHKFRKISRFSKEDRCASCCSPLDDVVNQGYKCAGNYRLDWTYILF